MIYYVCLVQCDEAILPSLAQLLTCSHSTFLEPEDMLPGATTCHYLSCPTCHYPSNPIPPYFCPTSVLFLSYLSLPFYAASVA